jgi:hypothetical protein
MNGKFEITLGGTARTGTRLRLYRVLAVPTSQNGSECWTLNKQVKRRIHAAKMRFGRAVSGFKKISHIRNRMKKRAIAW